MVIAASTKSSFSCGCSNIHTTPRRSCLVSDGRLKAAVAFSAALPISASVFLMAPSVAVCSFLAPASAASRFLSVASSAIRLFLSVASSIFYAAASAADHFLSAARSGGEEAIGSESRRREE